MKKLFFFFGLLVTSLNSYAQIYEKDIPRQSEKYSEEQNFFITELQTAYNDWMTEQEYFWRMPQPPSFGSGARSWTEVDRDNKLRQDYEKQNEVVIIKQSKLKNLLDFYKIKYINQDTLTSKKGLINKEPIYKKNKKKK